MVLAQQGETFSAYEDFTIIVCRECGIPFGVPVHWNRSRKKDSKSFYCPNGHCRCYRESEADRLRKELQKAEDEADRERLRANEARRQRDSVRKAHRKMRDRVKNGVCPCCNRSFENLHRHIRDKHPEFGENRTLRAVRDAYGMTQADLAEEIGVDQKHISCFEHGRNVAVWARDQIEAWLEDQGRAG